jgi:hypothetical protein
MFHFIFSQALQGDMVSVTKLCCPVCWELFKILRKLLKLDIRISGCHPSVTPLALPETFSPEIIKEMVIALRGQLVLQLEPLLHSKSPQKVQHSRHESETGHSATSSNNEGSTVFREAYNDWEEHQEMLKRLGR